MAIYYDRLVMTINGTRHVDGFSIERLDSSWIEYSDGSHKMRMPCEALYDPPGLGIFLSGRNWEPPHNQEIVSSDVRNVIRKRISALYAAKGIDIEFS